MKGFLSSLLRKKATAPIRKQKHINTPFEENAPTESAVGYSVVNAEEANFSTFKRKNYRVIVPRGITDAHLLRIFREMDNRSYDEITVWCYASREEINRSMPYTIAMIERTGKHSAPHITRR